MVFLLLIVPAEHTDLSPLPVKTTDCRDLQPTSNRGGEGEIRTHEPGEGSPVFKTGAINRSATSPWASARRTVILTAGRPAVGFWYSTRRFPAFGALRESSVFPANHR